VRGINTGIVLFLFFLLQALVSDRIMLGKIGPDFPLLFVCYFAVFKGALGGSIFGFVVGILQDLFNPSFLGLNALTKSLAGYAFGRVGAQIDRDNPLFLVGLFGVAALAHDFVYLLFFTGLHMGKFFLMWVTVSIPSALYTALVGGIVHTVVTLSMGEVVRHLGKTRS
jgi:rod shape-determining protein MreD